MFSLLSVSVWSQGLIAAWESKANFVVTARARLLVRFAANKSLSWTVAKEKIPSS